MEIYELEKLSVTQRLRFWAEDADISLTLSGSPTICELIQRDIRAALALAPFAPSSADLDQAARDYAQTYGVHQRIMIAEDAFKAGAAWRRGQDVPALQSAAPDDFVMRMLGSIENRLMEMQGPAYLSIMAMLEQINKTTVGLASDRMIRKEMDQLGRKAEAPPAPGVYSPDQVKYRNHREPGEFGEGATVADPQPEAGRDDRDERDDVIDQLRSTIRALVRDLREWKSVAQDLARR